MAIIGGKIGTVLKRGAMAVAKVSAPGMAIRTFPKVFSGTGRESLKVETLGRVQGLLTGGPKGAIIAALGQSMVSGPKRSVAPVVTPVKGGSMANWGQLLSAGVQVAGAALQGTGVMQGNSIPGMSAVPVLSGGKTPALVTGLLGIAKGAPAAAAPAGGRVTRAQVMAQYGRRLTNAEFAAAYGYYPKTRRRTTRRRGSRAGAGLGGRIARIEKALMEKG